MSMGVLYPFLHIHVLNLVKMQISLSECVGNSIYLSLCDNNRSLHFSVRDFD